MATSLSFRAYRVETQVPVGQPLRALLTARRAHSLRALLRTDSKASTIEWLGGSPVVVMDEGGVQERVTLVVLADGYALADQRTFAADVQSIFVGLFGESFYAENRSNFRVVRVDLVSAARPISEPNSPRDTAIGLTFTGNFADAWFAAYTAENYRRIRKVLAMWHLDGDIVCVLTNHAGNYGAFRNRLMAMTRGVPPRTLAHELGHAFGLLDEYTGTGKVGTYAGSEPTAANLTTVTDKTKIKWRDLIAPQTAVPTTSVPAGWRSDQDVGLFAGGWRDYTMGIYHPSDKCRMNDEKDPFCAVCRGWVSQVLRDALAHGGRPPDGGEPGATRRPRRVTFEQRPDGTAAILDIATSRLDVLPPPQAASGLVDVLWKGEEVIAATPVRDSESHGFGEPGPDGDMHATTIVDSRFDVLLDPDADPLDDLANCRVGRVELDEAVAGRSWVEAAQSGRSVVASLSVDDVWAAHFGAGARARRHPFD